MDTINSELLVAGINLITISPLIKKLMQEVTKYFTAL
jgi:hypothetical protein